MNARDTTECKATLSKVQQSGRIWCALENAKAVQKRVDTSRQGADCREDGKRQLELVEAQLALGEHDFAVPEKPGPSIPLTIPILKRSPLRVARQRDR